MHVLFIRTHRRLLQWYSLGVPTVYPFESITEYEDPNIHSANDVATSSEVRTDI
jgi:hypothetical protein